MTWPGRAAPAGLCPKAWRPLAGLGPGAPAQQLPALAAAPARRAGVTSAPGERVAGGTARFAARYMGDGRAAEFGARNAVPGELVVRVAPARVVAQRAIAS